MSDIKEKLQEIIKIEETIFILSHIQNKEKSLENYLGDSIRHQPVPPKKVNMAVREFPHYNEKEYLMKAKKEEHARYSKFRENCVAFGFFLIQTFIGIIICWIPWLVALCSFPFQVTGRRKAAYANYLHECKEIEANNKSAKEAQAKYDIEFKQYQRDVQKYNTQKAILPFQQSWLKKQIEKATLKKDELFYVKRKLYSDLKIPDQYQNYIAIQMLDYYFNRGSVFSTSDALELYKSSGIEYLSLSQLRQSCDIYRQTYPLLIASIEKCDKLCTQTYDDIYSHIKNQVENAINPLTENYPKTLIDTICTSI